MKSKRFCFKIACMSAGLLFCHVLLMGQANYQYDSEGRLIADLSEGITKIEWNNQSKVTHVVRADTSHAPDLEFAYDVLGNRCMKLVKPRNGNGLMPESAWKYTYYVNDAAGNPLSTYTRSYLQVSGNTFTETVYTSEQFVYGDGRVGSDNPLAEELANRSFTAAIGSNGSFQNVQSQGVLIPAISNLNTQIPSGNKYYELSNHIDNILVVVRDRKTIQENMTFASEVLSATDYYPFGMNLSSRVYNDSTYRFGFSAMEKDNEIKGPGNSYNFGGRSIYDPRIGKFTSVDPQWREAPETSPYAYGFNNPILFIDQNGEWPWDYRLKDIIDDDTHAATAFVYGFFDAAIDEGVDIATILVKSNPIFMPFFVGEQIDQAKFFYKLATDSKFRELVKEQIISSVKDQYDKVMGDKGTSQEIAYARGRTAMQVLMLAGPALAKGATTMYKGMKAARAAEKMSKVSKTKTVAKTVAKGTGCFLGDTEIRTFDGSFTYIKDISTEEEVYEVVFEEEEIPTHGVRLVIENWEVVVAPDQLFFVEDEWKKAEDLKEGDLILKLDGSTIPVTGVQLVELDEFYQKEKIVRVDKK